ncbi:LysM peptidoglycan-binding domain-containing protein [Psychrobacter sp. CAL346-MNA-CIBAN-0220]|uniref:SPOR and LysM peptidoglycan-binding domain-containing protein n=1 Tax=Psychrobacter sp. CAL346-MNA-CIBAN-0220 TaxID=3140457 RepID=UPI0033309013
MNFSRQALLGIGMILGGSVMLYAMVQQIGTSDTPEPKPAIVDKKSTEQPVSQPLTTDIDTEKRLLAQKQKERATRVAEQEKRAQQFLLEQENAEAQALAKARAENELYMSNIASTGGDSDSPEAAQNAVATPKAQPSADTSKSKSTSTTTTSSNNNDTQKVAAKEAEAKKQAEAKKLEDNKKQAKAKKQAEDVAKKKADAKQKAEEKQAAEKKEQIKKEQIEKKKAEKKAANEAAKNEPPKSAKDYTIKSGDGLLKLARQYNVSVEALAQANNIAPSATLQIGQALTIPSRKQIERLEHEAVAADKVRDEKRKKEEALAKKSVDAKHDAQQKLRAARKEVKETDAKGSFGVQVALATNQASADEVAKKFRSAGYKVKTSTTSRGVRVVVGPERGKVAALALKDKVNSDPDVNTTSAWVLYWR